ncbi:MAG: pantoate--beta-alanine ligase, partial [Nitrospirae bacterium]|nr:pantoate--beta-alanine ligase [Nitrospirota bacterium]
ALVHPETMEPVERLTGPVVVALAVWIGGTRLIDNAVIEVENE